jgi:hypothetical protein
MNTSTLVLLSTIIALPPVFNRDLTPRPACYAIRKLLAHPPGLSKFNP